MCGKGENAGIQHFLLFRECFLSCQRIIALFEQGPIAFCIHVQFGQVQPI